MGDLEATGRFGPDFVWGAATSAYQIEGAVAEDGRGPSIWDDFARTPGTIRDGSSGAVACDSYHRWKDDVALLESLGVDAYRFSVAWPRVQPDGSGSVNAAGLEYYDRLVDALLGAGIRPFVTLYHWDLPSALQRRQGGWVERDTAARFAEYAGLVAARLGDRVSDWMTLNEPFCSAWLGHLEGVMAPGLRDLESAVRASYHLLLGHGLAVQSVRAAAGRPVEVGMVANLSPCQPASDSDADREAASYADEFANRWFLDPIYGRGFPSALRERFGVDLPERAGDADVMAAPTDFLGVNYYTLTRVSADPTVATLGVRAIPAEQAQVTEMGWEVHPEGLTEILTGVARDYAPPRIYVSENGAAYPDVPDSEGRVDDDERAAYLVDHVDAVSHAIADGAPVAGYFAWSLIDNFEWAFGYQHRFGLAYVDYATQARTLKHSGQVYADLVRRAKGSGDLE